MDNVETSNNGKYYKSLLFLAIPIFLNGIIVQLQAIIGRAFLGNVKTEYLTAIGNTSFPFFASTSIPFTITLGLTILVAQNIGAKKYNAAKKYFESSFVYNLLISFCICMLWKFMAKQIFLLMDVKDPEILNYCINYLNIIILSIPIMGIEMILTAMLQGVGKTRPIFYSGGIKVLLSILLDYGLIFGKLGLPEIGYLGPAVSLVISGAASTIFLILFIFLKVNFPFEIQMKEFFKFKWGTYQDILRVGLPAGFELFAWYIATLFRLDFINKTGKNNVAIFIIIYGIELFVFQFYDSLAKATTTLVGEKTGSGEDNERKVVIKTVSRINAVVIFIVILSNVLFARQILGVFTRDRYLIESSIVYLITNTFTHYLRSLNVIYGAGIRALGDTKWMFYTQLIGTVLIILISYVLMFSLNLGLLGAFLAAFCDEFIRACLNVTRFFKPQSGKLLL